MSKLQNLHSDDVRYCNNRNSNGGLLRTFNENLGEHQMRILHEDGLYRHLRFKNPENGFYWFDLITWPGNLTITGDMGTYTFARTEDMFTFFTGYINSDYWAEKLRHGSSGGRSTVKNYDEELFKRWLVQDFWAYSRHMGTKVSLAWWLELKDEILGKHAYADIHSVEAVFSTLHELSVPDSLRHHYDDAYEAASSWEQYDWHFELCLASIVAGIRTYNTHKQAERDAQEPTK